ncbi:MAG: hypothetical protein U5N55_06115 [Cypionkella sp.]|nr:hypothetical protein [Cypionkella sp.]
MPCYFAAVEVHDPDGPANADDGEVYGGEMRLFVLDSADLSDALDALNASIATHGLALMRVLHAGPAETYDDDMLPFDVDIDAMVQTASEGEGEICVSEPQNFSPDETDGAPSGVYAVCADLFDPEWADEEEGTYAGHYQLAVIAAPNAAQALAMLLSDCTAHELIVQGLEGLVEADAFPFDAYDFEFDEEDPIGEVLDEGGMIWSNAYAYPPEAPRKLDS